MTFELRTPRWELGTTSILKWESRNQLSSRSFQTAGVLRRGRRYEVQFQHIAVWSVNERAGPRVQFKMNTGYWLHQPAILTQQSKSSIATYCCLWSCDEIPWHDWELCTSSTAVCAEAQPSSSAFFDSTMKNDLFGLVQIIITALLLLTSNHATPKLLFQHFYVRSSQHSYIYSLHDSSMLECSCCNCTSSRRLLPLIKY